MRSAIVRSRKIPNRPSPCRLSKEIELGNKQQNSPFPRTPSLRSYVEMNERKVKSPNSASGHHQGHSQQRSITPHQRGQTPPQFTGRGPEEVQQQFYPPQTLIKQQFNIPPPQAQGQSTGYPHDLKQSQVPPRLPAHGAGLVQQTAMYQPQQSMRPQGSMPFYRQNTPTGNVITSNQYTPMNQQPNSQQYTQPGMAYQIMAPSMTGHGQNYGQILMQPAPMSMQAPRMNIPNMGNNQQGVHYTMGQPPTTQTYYNNPMLFTAQSNRPPSNPPLQSEKRVKKMLNIVDPNTGKDLTTVKRVMGKLPILFNGVQIGVEEFKTVVQFGMEDSQEESEMILEVRGVSSSTSEDTVMMYFENTRRSGGGDVKNIRKVEDGVFHIIFEDEQVIDNVVSKQQNIDGNVVEVSKYVPLHPPMPVPTYSEKVFIKNICDQTTKDRLQSFLEVITSIKPVSVQNGELDGTAVVTFEKDIDFEKLQLACEKRSLDKSYLEVARVPITNCVIVKNISESTSQDTLEFYFNNERRSGVTGVLDVKKHDGFCLVYFEDPETVDVVCRRSHKVDGQDLDVKVYHECLGQVESDDDVPFQPPAPIEILNIDAKKLQFLIKSSANQQTVDKQLEAVYGKPVWQKKSKSNALTIECTLTPETKDCRKLARTWEAKVKVNLNRFLDLLFVEKHTTLQEAFPLVINQLKSLTINNPDAVAVILEKSNHEMYVTGHRKEVTEVSKQLADIIESVLHNFTQETMPSTNVMSQHYVDCETCGRYSDFYCNTCHQRMCGKCREEHLRKPHNSKHEVSMYKERKMKFTFNLCKLHPLYQMVLCCKRCQTPICAICTTNEHDGHGFLDLEEVCTKHFRIRFEEIRKIRDSVLPQSRVSLEESQRIIMETKEKAEGLRSIMKERAVRIKELVDSILTQSLQELQTYEVSVVSEAKKQEGKLDVFVTQMETLLDEYKNSISPENSEDFLSNMRNTPTVSLDPIPDVATAHPLTFCEGKLNKDGICEQFGFLKKRDTKEKPFQK